MCHFITLVAPTADEAAVRAVMTRHGRTARSIDNASLRGLLKSDERQYLTSRAGCDCGTVLASGSTHPAEDNDAETAKLARKGWSKARVERALADRRKAEARPVRGPDSLDLWARVVTDLRAELGLAPVGLFLHSYRGGIEDETFQAVREDAPMAPPLVETLAGLGEDRLMIFRA